MGENGPSKSSSEPMVLFLRLTGTEFIIHIGN